MTKRRKGDFLQPHISIQRWLHFLCSPSSSHQGYYDDCPWKKVSTNLQTATGKDGDQSPVVEPACMLLHWLKPCWPSPSRLSNIVTPIAVISYLFSLRAALRQNAWAPYRCTLSSFLSFRPIPFQRVCPLCPHSPTEYHQLKHQLVVFNLIIIFNLLWLCNYIFWHLQIHTVCVLRNLIRANDSFSLRRSIIFVRL